MKSFCQRGLDCKVDGYLWRWHYFNSLFTSKLQRISIKVLMLFSSSVMAIHAIWVASEVCVGYLNSSSKHRSDGAVNVSSGLLSRRTFCTTGCVDPKLEPLWVLIPIDLLLANTLIHVISLGDCCMQCCTFGLCNYKNGQIKDLSIKM